MLAAREVCYRFSRFLEALFATGTHYMPLVRFRIALHITCRRFDSESRMKISVDDWLYLSGVRRVCSGTSLAGKLVCALEVRMLDDL